MAKPRRAGSPWRILVHEYRGASHDVTNDPDFGQIPRRMRTKESDQISAEMRARAVELGCTETVLAGTEFDELVVGRWIHLEQMDTGTWWMNVGGVTLWVTADRDGRPRTVTVYGPGRYAEPVDGVEYECTWGEVADD